MGAVSELVSVEVADPTDEVLRGCYLDAPSKGSRAEANALEVSGWVLGAHGPVAAVEFCDGDRLVWRTPVEVARPDLAAAFPDVAWAERAGFATTLSTTGTTADLVLRISAVLPDEARVPVASLRIRRGWRHGPPGEAALVSVVIPCYNQAHFLAEAVESVIAQTHPHHEVVVVDDGSTDNTREVAARYPGVRCVRQRNAGLAAARNTGIRRSNGDFLVFLDADDRLRPKALQAGLDDLRAHPECAFVSGHYRRVSLDGSPIPTPELPCAGADPYETLLRSNYVGMPATALYRREVFEHVAAFDTSLPACEDYDLNLRIARRFPVHCHEHVVADYRRHGSSMSGDLPRMLASAITVMRRQRPHLRDSAEHRAAYQAGVRFWRGYYGDPLRRDLAARLSAGDWRPGVRELVALARYHPRALSRLRDRSQP